MTSPVRLVDEQDVREALAPFRDLDVGRPRPIPGGQAYFTFELDSGWIFRFPRNATVAQALEREMRLLPWLADRLSFAVPRFRYEGRFRDWPFAGYRRIPGRALEPSDLQASLVKAIGCALSELHAVPPDEVRERLGEPGTIAAWRTEYRDLLAQFEQRLAARLEPPVRAAVARGFERFLERQIGSLTHPTLVHCDLGCEHVLIDPETRELRGMIDFEEAHLGDPAIDIVGLRLGCGAPAAATILSAYTVPRDPAFDDRVLFYQWVSAIHESLYALDQRDDSLLTQATTALTHGLREADLLP